LQGEDNSGDVDLLQSTESELSAHLIMAMNDDLDVDEEIDDPVGVALDDGELRPVDEARESDDEEDAAYDDYLDSLENNC